MVRTDTETLDIPYSVLNLAAQLFPLHRAAYTQVCVGERDWTQLPLLSRATLGQAMERHIQRYGMQDQDATATAGSTTGHAMYMVRDEMAKRRIKQSWGWLIAHARVPLGTRALLVVPGYCPLQEITWSVDLGLKWKQIGIQDLLERPHDPGLRDIRLVYTFPDYLDILGHQRSLAAFRERVNWMVSCFVFLPPSLYQRITASWDGMLIDAYGMSEVGGLLAIQIHGRWHIQGNDLFIEIVTGNGQPVEAGAPGEIVVTVRSATTVPLVRYRTGDYARAAGVWPRQQIAVLMGRVTDTWIDAVGQRRPVMPLIDTLMGALGAPLRLAWQGGERWELTLYGDVSIAPSVVTALISSAHRAPCTVAIHRRPLADALRQFKPQRFTSVLARLDASRVG